MGNTVLSFFNKSHGLQKNIFIEKIVFFVDYVKIIELYVVQT